MTTEIEIQVGLKSGMADPEGVNVKKYLDLYSLFEMTPQVILLNQFIKKGNLKFKVNINFKPIKYRTEHT